MSSDPWLQGCEQANEVAVEIQNIIQERSLKHPDGGPAASRLTSNARRKLGTLGTQLDSLRAGIEASTDISENERNRRRDLVAALRQRRETLQDALRRDAGHGAARSALLAGGTDVTRSAARETEATAARDAGGLLQLQRQVIEEQDRELEELERGVGATKHVALRINEEATLHNRLLEGLDEDVDVSRARMAAAQRRLRTVMRRSGACKTQLLIFIILLVLVVVIVVAFKVVF